MGRDSWLAYNRPEVDEDEIRAVVQVLRSGWITRGPVTDQFEQALAQYLQVPAVAAVSSCTAALHLGLLLHDIGPGDEVITTPMTFAASVNVIIETGATPILADIDPATGNLDLASVAALITPRTRAVMPVHYGGQPVDMAALNELARKSQLVVVEDAAHAMGSQQHGRPVGSFGNVAALSFYATKNLTTGEGGALTLFDEESLLRVRELSLHGLSRHAWNRYGLGGSWQYDVTRLGFKYNMTDIQAAMGLAQLAKFPALQKKRVQLAARYRELLTDLPLALPALVPGFTHSWHLYPIVLDLSSVRGTRDDVIEDMRQSNIGTSVHFIPIYRHTYYAERFGWRSEDYPGAESFYAGQISLPLYPALSLSDVDDVAAALAASLAGRRRE